MDADHFHDGGINFPAVWTDPGFSGVLPKGDSGGAMFCRAARRAICWCSRPFDEIHKAGYATTVTEVLAVPGVYRKRFRAHHGHSTANDLLPDK